MAARLAVGVVLLVAGAAKLAQPAWRATAVAFGAPSWLAPVLPWSEMVLGALLLSGVGLPWTAAAALGLLGMFTLAVAYRLYRGDQIPCGCFGETSPAPVGPGTLVRNLVLCALALAAVFDTGGGGVVSGLLGVAGGLAIVAQSRWRRPG